jgi:hypothetical protein
MTEKLIPETQLDIKAGIEIGPRLRADIERRIRALEARWPGARTAADWAELARLLHLVETARLSPAKNQSKAATGGRPALGLTCSVTLMAWQTT